MHSFDRIEGMSDNQNNLIQEILEKSAYYKEQFDNLSIATLSKIAVDRQKALEIARNVIEQDNSVNLSGDFITKLADEMQTRAKALLEERSNP